MYLETETTSKLSRMHLINVDAVLNIEKESETPTETIPEIRNPVTSLEGRGGLEKLPKTKLQTAWVVSAYKVAQSENIKWVWIDECCITTTTLLITSHEKLTQNGFSVDGHYKT